MCNQGKALHCAVPVLCTTGASDVHMFAATREVGEYFSVLSTQQTKLKEAEGLTETRMAWDDFTVGWHVL